MATKAEFTEEEWKAMQKGVTGAGMLVSAGDRDFTDSFGEAGALAKYLAAQRETSESDLVRELANVRSSGFGLTDSAQEVQAETLAALRDALATLAAKAPDEMSAYRRLVLDAAEAVAEAKGGVKPGETAALEAIKEALGPA
jgi:tellurite resistance protein